MSDQDVLIFTPKPGRQERIVGKNVSISAGIKKDIVNIAGKTGSIIGGNIVFEHHSTPLHDIEIELMIDGLIIFTESLSYMNTYKIRKDEQNPVYLIKYYEDATTFGSWVDYSYANFTYIVGLNPSAFKIGCFLSINNVISVDITIDYLIQYMITVEGT